MSSPSLSLVWCIFFILDLSSLLTTQAFHPVHQPFHQQPFTSFKTNTNTKISDSPTYNYKEYHFLQDLDHFNYNNLTGNIKFSQRYLVADQYWSGAAAGGPIFFYTGNEGDIYTVACLCCLFALTGIANSHQLNNNT